MKPRLRTSKKPLACFIMTPRAPSLFAALITVPLSLSAVEVGDTHDEVVAELGRPAGSASVGASTILFYDRGEVKLRDGAVTSFSLVTPQELAARQAAEAEAQQRREEAERTRLERLEAQGRAEMAAKKSNARLAVAPALDQLAYWRAFAARYPMIAVDHEIAPLLEQAQHELRLREIAAENEARLAELEARVVAAEQQAAEAEREARRRPYVYSGYPHPRPRPYPPHHPHRPDDPPRERQETTPPQNPIDADRAKAMADYEEARQRAYAGGN
jgi:hypothetical protein